VSRPPTLFVRRASGLIREVGPWTALATTMSWTIGGGVNWLMIKVSYDFPGANIPLAFLMVGIGAILTAIAYSYLLASMPRTGGDYIFISRGLNPLLAFALTWGYWLATAIATGTIAFWDVWYWGLSLQIAGVALGDKTLIAIGNALSTDPLQMLILGTILTIGMGLVAFFGIRTYTKLIWIFFAIPVIGSMVMFAALINGNIASAKALFDAAFGAGTWDSVLKIAYDVGFNDKIYGVFSWEATAGALLSPMFAFVGCWSMVSYIGGEIKEPSKTAIWGGVMAVLVITLYMVGASFLVYGAYGKFIGAYTYAFFKAKDRLAEVMPYTGRPMLPFFVAGLMPGQPILQILVSLIAALWLLNDIPAFYLVSTRLPFSWSFDRFFPELLAEVNRYGSPTWSILLAMILAEISVIGWYWGEAFGYYGLALFVADLDSLSTLLWWLPSVFGSLAAVILPFYRKDLYDRSPLKHEISGIPVMSIAGLGAFFMQLFLYMSLLGSGHKMSLMLELVLFYTIGAAIFIFYLVYNAKRGIDIKTLFGEIPPM